MLAIPAHFSFPASVVPHHCISPLLSRIDDSSAIDFKSSAKASRRVTSSICRWVPTKSSWQKKKQKTVFTTALTLFSSVKYDLFFLQINCHVLLWRRGIFLFCALYLQGVFAAYIALLIAVYYRRCGRNLRAKLYDYLTLHITYLTCINWPYVSRWDSGGRWVESSPLRVRFT